MKREELVGSFLFRLTNLKARDLMSLSTKISTSNIQPQLCERGLILNRMFRQKEWRAMTEVQVIVEQQHGRQSVRKLLPKRQQNIELPLEMTCF